VPTLAIDGDSGRLMSSDGESDECEEFVHITSSTGEARRIPCGAYIPPGGFLSSSLGAFQQRKPRQLMLGRHEMHCDRQSASEREASSSMIRRRIISARPLLENPDG